MELLDGSGCSLVFGLVPRSEAQENGEWWFFEFSLLVTPLCKTKLIAKNQRLLITA
jgi:hypothetical protein